MQCDIYINADRATTFTIFLDSNRVGPILVHTAYGTSSHSSVLNLLNLYSNFTFFTFLTTYKTSIFEKKLQFLMIFTVLMYRTTSDRIYPVSQKWICSISAVT